MKTARVSGDSEILLTDSELRLLVHSMFSKYAIYVFKILRATELEGYYPATRERDSAYSELCITLVCKEFADQILEFHLGAERQRRIHDGAEEDVHFLEAVEALRGMRTAPLMAELRINTACTLWARAGSWAGAMMLAGLDPLKNKERRDAVRRYAIRCASPELLPSTIRKTLTRECVIALGAICDNARKRGRYPTFDEIQRGQELIQNCGLKINDVFRSIGLKISSATQKKKKVTGPATGWKAYNYWWLNSAKYKAHQRAASEANRLRYQETDGQIGIQNSMVTEEENK